MTPPEFVQSWFSTMNISPSMGTLITTVCAAAVVLMVGIMGYFISKSVMRIIITRIVERTKTRRDDIVLEKNFFNRLPLLVPALVIQFFVPVIFREYAQMAALIGRVVNIYFIIAAVLVADALINAFTGIYRTFKVAREIPLTGFVQVIKIILYFLGVIFVISVVFNRAPLLLFSGLGAMTAVLMLIFKDPILGFVAGIQLISNRMLKQGDWIEMPKYGADGDVIDITLTTVKVRNWDKTITTIPTYALISDSFKNWRGMQESGGRRIKRAIHIDMSTIRFCTPEMVARLSGIKSIKDYLNRKNVEIEQYNTGLGTGADHPVNFRRLTNIGTFRAYVAAYLQSHPMINTEMTFLVRQLAPGADGLPLEIYVFCKDKAWAAYEAVMADIFDHLLAILPEFELRVFQHPSGSDFQNLASANSVLRA